jgi:hypothetical protein
MLQQVLVALHTPAFYVSRLELVQKNNLNLRGYSLSLRLLLTVNVAGQIAILTKADTTICFKRGTGSIGEQKKT